MKNERSLSDQTRERVNVLGVGISPINMMDAVSMVEHWINNKRQNYVCVAPVHSILDCQRDTKLKQIFNRSGLTTPDGTPLVWLLKMYRYRDVERVYGPDLLLAVCERSETPGYRHYFYGGSEEVLEKLTQRLEERFKNLRIAGYYSPAYHQQTEVELLEDLERINMSNADIVWVGLGSPKQERWMAQQKGRLTAPVMIGVGAAFDFISGHKPQAPRWIQRSGFEWLFRLTTEPRRLWKRYIRYPLFPVLIALQALKIKDYPIER